MSYRNAIHKSALLVIQNYSETFPLHQHYSKDSRKMPSFLTPCFFSAVQCLFSWPLKSILDLRLGSLRRGDVSLIYRGNECLIWLVCLIEQQQYGGGGCFINYSQSVGSCRHVHEIPKALLFPSFYPLVEKKSIHLRQTDDEGCVRFQIFPHSSPSIMYFLRE